MCIAHRVCGLIVRSDPACFQARKIQQRIHQLEQPQLITMDSFQFLAAQYFFGFASASSVGPSIRVKGVRNSWLTLLKKVVFARSSCRQFFRALPLTLISAGIADSRGNLPGYKINESGIAGISCR